MNTTAPEIFAAKGVVKSNDWIGFMGSFLGSLIAGILTLGGVYLTIKEQRVESTIEKFPHRLRHLDKLYDYFNLDRNRKIQKNYDDGMNGLVNDAITEIYRNKDELIKNATEVNGYFYLEVKNIIEISEQWCKKFPREKRRSAYDNLTQNEYSMLKRANYPDFIIELNKWLQNFDEMYKDFVEEQHKLITRRRKIHKLN